MTSLDRYLLRNFARNALLVTAATLTVFLVLDILMTFNLLVRKNPEGPFLFLEFFACRIPELANFALPVSAVVSVLACSGPMLRRGEYVALSAAGIGPQRAAIALLLGCLAVGAVDVLVADLITPRTTTRSLAIQDQLEGQSREGRVWRVDEHKASWFAGGARLVGVASPELTQVVIATPQRLAQIDQIIWDGRSWTVVKPGVAMHGGDEGQSLERLASGPLPGDLALPYRPEQLYQRLLPRYTMTTSALLARGERADVATVCGRWTRLFLPLLAAMAALPIFVRFVNTHTLAVAAVQASLVALVPVVLLVLTALSADNTPAPPWIAVPLGILVSATPALVLWRRWRL